MNQPPSHCNPRNWRELYTAALFETDTHRIPSRIDDAERVIFSRARELFAAGADTIEEDQALEGRSVRATRPYRTAWTFAQLLSTN